MLLKEEKNILYGFLAVAVSSGMVWYGIPRDNESFSIKERIPF